MRRRRGCTPCRSHPPFMLLPVRRRAWSGGSRAVHHRLVGRARRGPLRSRRGRRQAPLRRWRRGRCRAEDVGHDETTLRQVGARPASARRARARDEVVGEVAETGSPRLGLLEGDQPRAAPNKSVAAEAALLDQLNRKLAHCRVGQAQVSPRDEEVGGDGRVVSSKRKDLPVGRSGERSGIEVGSGDAPAGSAGATRPRTWSGSHRRAG